VALPRHDPPARFVDLVDRRADDLSATVAEVTGDARLARQLRLRILAGAAARWWWLGRVRAGAADAYLDRRLRESLDGWTRDPDGLRPAALELVTEGSPYVAYAAAQTITPAAALGPVGPPPRGAVAGDTPAGNAPAADALAGASPAGDALPGEPPPAGTLTGEPLGGVALAGVAWRKGRRLAARRALVAAGTAVAVLAVLAAHPGRPVDETYRPEPVAVPAGARLLPAETALRGLPRRATSLPVTVDLDRAATPVPLGSSSGGLLALVQPSPGDTVALATGGRRYRLPAALTDTSVGQPALLPDSVSPNGRYAAFPGVYAVTVVDLAAGTSRAYSVFGQHDAVVWRTNDRFQVASPSGVSAEVTLSTADVNLVPYLVAEALACPRTCPDVYELRPPQGPGLPNPRLVHWVGNVRTDRTLRAAPGSGLDPAWVGTWVGPGMRDGDLAVRVATTLPVPLRVGGTPVFMVAAIDLPTAELRHALLATDRNGYGRPPEVLGLLGDGEVLLRVGATLVTWWPARGVLRLVSMLSWPSVVALVNPSGW
jgi:hypothetical protein